MLTSPAETLAPVGSTWAPQAITLERPERLPVCRAFLVKCQGCSKQTETGLEPAQRPHGGSWELRPPGLQLSSPLSFQAPPTSAPVQGKVQLVSHPGSCRWEPSSLSSPLIPVVRRLGVIPWLPLVPRGLPHLRGRLPKLALKGPG